MQKRTLGTQGLKISAIGLGCMGISEFYGPGDEAESIATINRAIELGIDFFDTSDIYGPFTNEVLVGKALRPHRDKVVIATKFGIVRDPDGTGRGVNGRPEYVRQACDASLKRLGIDTIDLYYQHRIDPSTPIEETVGAMAELVRAARFAISVFPKPHRKPFAAPTQCIPSAHFKLNTHSGAAIRKSKSCPPCAS